jgi:hypothetical protein
MTDSSTNSIRKLSRTRRGRLPISLGASSSAGRADSSIVVVSLNIPPAAPVPIGRVVAQR